MAERAADADALLARVAAGDHGALGELYDALAARLFAACVRASSGAGEADALARAVWIDVWRRAPRWDPGRLDARTWIDELLLGRLRSHVVARHLTATSDDGVLDGGRREGAPPEGVPGLDV